MRYIISALRAFTRNDQVATFNPSASKHQVRSIVIAVFSVLYLLLLNAHPVMASEWKESQFIASCLDSIAADSVSARYTCTQRTQLGPTTYLFDLPTNLSADSVSSDCNAATIPGVPYACVNRIASVIVPQDDSNPSLDPIPDGLLPQCNLVQDALFSEQWPLAADFLNICGAWSHTHGDSNTIIVLMDDGLDTNHIDFAADVSTPGTRRRIVLKNLLPPNQQDDDPINEDHCNHGTMTAGIIGAIHNDAGIAGIAPQCPLWIIKIMYTALVERDEYGYAQGGYVDLSTYFTALDSLAAWAAIPANRSKHFVVNCSFGWDLSPNSPEVAIMRDHMLACNAYQNVLFICAAGPRLNIMDASKSDEGKVPYVAYPAAFSGGVEDPYYSAVLDDIVVAVTSITVGDFSDGKYRIAPDSRGPWAFSDTCRAGVDVCGPGGGGFLEDSMWYVRVPSWTSNTDSAYRHACGTSMAAAHISGVAALRWATSPSELPRDVKDSLRAWTKRLSYPYCYSSNPDLRNLWEFYYFAGRHADHYFGTDIRPYCPYPTISEPVFPMGEDDMVAGRMAYDKSGISVALGSGVVDASLLVGHPLRRNVARIYGGTLSESVWLDDIDAILVFGDLSIDNSATMHIEARDGLQSVPVRISQQDLYGGGLDSNRVEIHVASGGGLISNCGLDWMPMDYSYGRGQWYGLVIGSNGIYGDPVSKRDCALACSKNGVTVSGGTLNASSLAVDATDIALRVSGTVNLHDMLLESEGIGLCMEPGAHLQLTGSGGSNVHSRNKGYGVGIAAAGAGTIEGTSNVCISGYATGLVLMPNASLSVAMPSLFDSCGVGIYCGSSSSLAIADSVTIRHTESIGMELCSNTNWHTETGGILYLQDGLYGIRARNASSIYVRGGMIIDSPALSAIYLDNASNVSIHCPADSAIVLSAGQSGLKLSNASAMVDGCDFASCGGAGAECIGASLLTLRNSTFLDCANGVVIGDNSVGNLGELPGDAGNNWYRSIQSYFITNLNYSQILRAEGNSYWNGTAYTCPPKAYKIYGPVSTTCQ